MKAVVATLNQEKALLGAFSVIAQLQTSRRFVWSSSPGSQDTFCVITSQEQLMLDVVKTTLIVIVQSWSLTHWELLGKGANIESVYLVILINSSHSPFSAPMRNFCWSSNMNNYLLTCRQTIICEIVISRNSDTYDILFETMNEENLNDDHAISVSAYFDIKI